MSVRRVADGKIELPENVSWIDFPRTDGDARLGPPNTTRVVDSDGHVNFMQFLELDAYTPLKWRISAGKAISLELGMQAGPNYVLRAWPDGYRMFDHHKGPQSNPRHDIYLFGSPKGRFRSINEFIPHAIWLMKESTMDNSKCLCKYCSKKSQKDITASMSNILSVSPSPVRVKRDRPQRPRDPLAKRDRQHDRTVYAAVQRKVVPIQPSPDILPNPMLVERNADLRAIYSQTSMALKRWFREGELVWCALKNPIIGPDEESTTIKFWPALVEQVKLKSLPVPNSVDAVNIGDASITEYSSTLGNGRGVVMETDNIPPSPWTVRQWTTYKTQLLGVSHSYTVADDQVLPYQAHIPPQILMNALLRKDPTQLDFTGKEPSKFNPCPGTHTPDFGDAVGPYATAIQIGASLSGFYCLTDEWKFKYSIPPPPPTPPVPANLSTPVLPAPTPIPALPQQDPTSLSSAIEAAARSNAQMSASGSGDSSPYLPNQYYRNVAVAGPSSSTIGESELQTVSRRVLGVNRTPSNPDQFIQHRYQGMWWGAERIWVDDFVRLKTPRNCLAPNGAPNVLPPSGPSEVALDRWKHEGKTDTSELGAGSRGVFMRLDALVVVDAEQNDGSVRKECRACGMLYELADEEWVDPLETNGPNAAGPSSQHAKVDRNVQPSLSTSQLTPHSSSASTPDPLLLPNRPTMPLPRRKTPTPTTRSAHYLLPQAPEGYKFRPILPPGHEAVMSLGLVSGRYYPRILEHPLLNSVFRNAMELSPEDEGLSQSEYLWALEGLTPGFLNSVEPTEYKKSRLLMLEEADKRALAELESHRVRRMAAQLEDNMVADDDKDDELEVADFMEVDDLVRETNI